MFYCCFLSGKISEKSVEISPRFAIILAYFYTHVQGLRIRAGRPVYEMRTSHILTERGLIAMRNRTTLLRAEQSRAEHGLTASFLRLAIARRMKLNTTFVMDNRRILTGKYTLSGSAVFVVQA